MHLRDCSCKFKITTKNADRVIRNEMGIWFNCPECRTTLVIRDKSFKPPELPELYPKEEFKELDNKKGRGLPSPTTTEWH